MLRAQYANGGWPQFYPKAAGYSRHITFNDNAMIGVMSTLRDVARCKPEFIFVDEALRRRAAATQEFCENAFAQSDAAIEDGVGRIAVAVHPDAEAVRATEWQKWHIALGEVRAAGVDVAAVQKMAIGVGDRKNPKPGGTGRVYIDDIRLTKRMPQLVIPTCQADGEGPVYNGVTGPLHGIHTHHARN